MATEPSIKIHLRINNSCGRVVTALNRPQRLPIIKRIINALADRFGDRKELEQQLQNTKDALAITGRIAKYHDARCETIQAELRKRLADWHATNGGLTLKLQRDTAVQELRTACNAYVDLRIQVEAYREALA